MSERGKTLLKGHTLLCEGASFDTDGLLKIYDQSSPGRAKCSCGALSEPLPSRAARKRWHRAHKDGLRKASA